MNAPGLGAPTPLGPGLDPPPSALVVVAHPDDAEFQCGATLAKWARAGATVHHLVLTDGSKGTWDRHADQGKLRDLRRNEQHSAARALGANGEVVFADQIDGELTRSLELRAFVAQVIRRVRPAVVLGHDPWKRYRLHPDHRAAGEVVIDGIVAARDPFFHPEQLAEGLEPFRPEALLLFEPDEVNHLEIVSDLDVQSKVDALMAHRSQLETTHFYRLDHLDEARATEAFTAEQHSVLQGRPGAPDGALSEAFHAIVDQL